MPGTPVRRLCPRSAPHPPPGLRGRKRPRLWPLLTPEEAPRPQTADGPANNKCLLKDF